MSCNHLAHSLATLNLAGKQAGVYAIRESLVLKETGTNDQEFKGLHDSERDAQIIEKNGVIRLKKIIWILLINLTTYYLTMANVKLELTTINW